MKTLFQKFSNPNLGYFGIVAGIFLLMISPNFLSQGMFMDGLIYATVAKNLSFGFGSFWEPQFSQTLMSPFHEHPPLAFGLQRFFYSLFGDGYWIEKLYSVLTFVISAVLIVYIWKYLKKKHAWIPLLLWILMPLVGWASTNNMLENTLTIWILSSVLMYLKGEQKNCYLYIILSGCMLSLGFLTKGFVAFFPLTLPLIWFLFVKRTSFKQVTIRSLVLLLSTFLPLFCLYLLIPEAKKNLNLYLELQVIGSIKSIVTVESRFFILKKMLLEIAIPLCFVLFFFIRSVRNKTLSYFSGEDAKKAWAFLVLGLCGVVPIMISLKQRGFYMTPALPLFAISIGLLLYAQTQALLEKWAASNLYKKWLGIVGGTLLLSGILLTIFFAGKYQRDAVKIKDMKVIIKEIPSESTAQILTTMYEDWSLYGYYQRFGRISLTADTAAHCTYLIVENAKLQDPSILKSYEKIDLPLEGYSLYKKP